MTAHRLCSATVCLDVWTTYEVQFIMGSEDLYIYLSGQLPGQRRMKEIKSGLSTVIIRVWNVEIIGIINELLTAKIINN